MSLCSPKRPHTLLDSDLFEEDFELDLGDFEKSASPEDFAALSEALLPMNRPTGPAPWEAEGWREVLADIGAQYTAQEQHSGVALEEARPEDQVLAELARCGSELVLADEEPADDERTVAYDAAGEVECQSVLGLVELQVDAPQGGRPEALTPNDIDQYMHAEAAAEGPKEKPVWSKAELEFFAHRAKRPRMRLPLGGC